jgi:membrane protein implicated in regulation of membrane protease activity
VDFIVDNIAQTLIVVGIIALIIEVVILGFATFVLFFLGLSLILSGGLMYAGLIEQNWLNALWINAVLTFLLSLSLWKPLKRMQENVEPHDVKNDFAEIEFILSDDVHNNSNVQYAYSGIHWQLKSNTPIAKGTMVKVVKKEVGVLWIEPMT